MKTVNAGPVSGDGGGIGASPPAAGTASRSDPDRELLSVNLLPVLLTCNPDIRYPVLRVLNQAQQTIFGTQYCLADCDGCSMLRQRCRAGV